MAKKFFIAATIIILIAFTVTAIFRCLSSFEFRKLEFTEPGASLENYTLFTRISMVAGRICQILCYLYPISALLLWLREKETFTMTLGVTFASTLFIAAMMYSIPFVTGGRVAFGNINFFLFFCLTSYLQVFLLCLVAAKLKKVI